MSDEPLDELDDEIETARNVEIGKMADRWQRDAPAIMTEAYRAFTGLKPPEAWSFTVRKASAKLANMQLDNGEDTVARFLRESMLAFSLRCGGSYQVEPTSPFFADTYLFSATALDYLEKNQRRIRGHAWVGSDPQAFSRKVFEDIVQSEIDYWQMGHPNSAPALELTRPGVYWIIFSRFFQRFGDILDLDRQWAAWDYEVDYMGRATPIKDAVDRERMRLKNDRSLQDMAVKAALDAFWEAALVTWTRFGIGTVGIDDRNQMVLPEDGKELKTYRYYFDEGAGGTLWDWELRWRAYLSRELGLEFDADDFTASLTAITKAKPKLSATKLSSLVSIPGRGLSPFMAAALAESEED